MYNCANLKLHTLIIGILINLAALECHAQGVTYSVSNLWSIGSGAGRTYVTSGNTERGVSYNPINNHAYIVSRASGTKVAIVDGDTGADIGTLNVTGVTGGTFALSTISVAEDGTIYAANLTTGSATSPYKIYKWTSESTAPVLVYSANPSGGANNNRYGDCAIDVRGSGLDTEILTAAQNNPIAVLFRPTDATLGTFTSTRLDITGLPGAGDLTKGIAFGIGNTFYGKNNGNTGVRYCTYNPTTGTGAFVSTFTVDSVAAIDVDPIRKLIAGADCGNNTTAHSLHVYDLTAGATPTSIFVTPFATPYTANGNAVGQVSIVGDRIIAIDTQNGAVMAKIYSTTAAVPPGISQAIGTNTVVEGGYITLSMAATGTKPLSYQWYHEGTIIDGAATNFLNLTNVSMMATGSYTVTVANTAGSTNSQPGYLNVTPSVRSPVLSPLWNLEPGSRPWLTTDNNQRGLAFNAQTAHLLVISRSPTNAIYILDALTGAEIGNLNVDPTIITGGTFAINLIGVADDGSIYAANLTTGASGTPFKLYRWPYEDTAVPPTLVYSGDPANGTGGTTSVRWGDNMDVRGSAPVQVILGSRAGSKASLLSSPDGASLFTATPISTDVPDGALGLGIAFGAGNTFWGRATATALRQIQFDPVSGTSATLHTYGPSVFPGSIGPIAVDPVKNYLAGISIETPDNVRLYNIAELSQPPLEVDTKFFPTDNANANGTGSADFGPEHLFTLDSNNGIMAFQVQGPPTITCPSGKTVECGTGWTFDDPTAVDFCDANVPIIVASTTTNSTCGSSFTATRIWMATNSCGNRAQCSQTVTVVDTTPPTVICQPDKTVQCGTPWTFDTPTVTDCGVTTNNVVSTVTNALAGNSYSVTRTWTAVDGCGNLSGPCSQTVTVSDTQPPVITLLGANPVTIELHGTYTESGATAQDVCAGDLTSQLVLSDNINVNQAGTYTVRYNVTDPNGNAAIEVTRTVNVVDSSPAPTLTIEQQGDAIVISWPDSPTNYTLQETSDLTAPITWVPANANMSTSGGRKIATVPNSGGNKFFRLSSPP